MPFQEVNPKPDFPEQERQILQFWQDTHAFERLRQVHQNDPQWSFIDGPITANNPMGVHHGWGRTYKDLFQRFWTMRGRKLRYQNGFDCQGLWVEVNVEKEMGFTTKKDIEDYGLELFVRMCKARVLRYAAVQTEQSIRLGYWMDWNDPDQLRWLAEKLMEDPAEVITLQGPEGPVTGTVEGIVGRLGLPELGGSYFTFSDENNYMIWTFLKKCWQKGWLYRGADVMPWCPRCATAISQHEIVTDGYAELTHRSVTLRFPLRGRPGESLLVWTTTPWTLTSNVAAAVGPDLAYARVRQGEQVFYLSKGTLHMLRGDYELLGELTGRDMAGWTYDGPFDDLPPAQQPGGFTHLNELTSGVDRSAVQAHQVILWDAVGETEGTGIVHIAPGCGAEDFQLGRQHGFPLIAPLDDEGRFVDGFAWLSGMDVAHVATPIFEDLQRKALLYHVEPYTHRYPTCWRCRTELVFRLVDEWFISMGVTYDKPREQLTAEEKAASLRYQIMDVVDQIRWIPEFGHAREMDWLRNMHDWMISKKRYWGLALPIWVCEECSAYEVVGDEAELQARAVTGWDEFAPHTPHRPFIDLVKLACPHCGGRMSRIPDVGNPWLDAGIVSFSTLRYRSDPAYWRSWYPAHWISESFPGQFRNWFYSLLAMATVLDSSPPFLQNFGYATLLAEDGRPMHKSWGNAIEFNEAADKMGVDVMRWLFCAHKPENELLFGYGRGDEARRRFLIPLWNVYSFLATYARLDGWEPSLTPNPLSPLGKRELRGEGSGVFNPAVPEGTAIPEGESPRSDNLLDRWILARLDQVVARVTSALEDSDPLSASLALEALLDDLSNWYVRRSRRRFWKSEHDQDKNAAYSTLYFVMVRLARLLAPFIPFLSEAIYQNLVVSVYPEAYPSVHHTAWPPHPQPLPLRGGERGGVEEVESLLAQMSLAQPNSLDFAPDPSRNFPADEEAARDALLAQMALARQIASLGLSARTLAGLKVRQPLSRVLVYSAGGVQLGTELVEIILDELNVKAFEVVADASTLVAYRVQPDNKLLGPRFGARFPQARVALAALDPAAVAASVLASQPVLIELEDGPVELAPNEVLVTTQPAEGLAVAADKLLTVAIDSALTPELVAEGLAREIVRRVQAMRKDAGFDIADRITTCYTAPPELQAVFQTWGSYIKAETLTTSLVEADLRQSAPPPGESPVGGSYTQSHTLEGHELTLALLKS